MACISLAWIHQYRVRFPNIFGKGILISSMTSLPIGFYHATLLCTTLKKQKLVFRCFPFFHQHNAAQTPEVLVSKSSRCPAVSGSSSPQKACHGTLEWGMVGRAGCWLLPKSSSAFQCWFLDYPACVGPVLSTASTASTWPQFLMRWYRGVPPCHILPAHGQPVVHLGCQIHEVHSPLKRPHKHKFIEVLEKRLEHGTSMSKLSTSIKESTRLENAFLFYVYVDLWCVTCSCEVTVLIYPLNM